MTKTTRPCTAVAAAALLLVAVGVRPAAAMQEMTEPEILQMNTLDYEEHTKPFVEFKHRNHTGKFPQKFPQFFEKGCGTCHHDDEGEPLTELAPGDDINYCVDCHSEPGTVPGDVKKQMRARDLTRAEKKSWELEYHAEAVHDLCRGCHREVRKHDRATKAPTTCMQCHTKDES